MYKLKNKVMTNQEKKQSQWDNLKSKYSHLENHCTIKLNGINDGSIYYHPTFEIEEGTTITTQCDVENNKNYGLYAHSFTSKDNGVYGIPIYEEYLENVIISWKQNKEVVLLAFDTLDKVKKHVNKMNDYANEYVNNLLIGNSISQLSNDFINEIKTATKVIELMQGK